MVSYCHQLMSGVRRQQLLQTTSLKPLSLALIFDMYYCIVDLYQVCSNGSPEVQNGPAAGVLGSKSEIYLKIFFSRNAWLR